MQQSKQFAPHIESQIEDIGIDAFTVAAILPRMRKLAGRLVSATDVAHCLVLAIETGNDPDSVALALL